jgi:hypothetical protein
MSFPDGGRLYGHTLCTALGGTDMISTPTLTATDSSARSGLFAKPVWMVGLAAAVAGAVVTSLFAVVADAVGVPLEVASKSGGTPEAIPAAGFATIVLAAGVIGTLLALAFDRWAKRPARTFLIVTGVLALVSMASPFMAQEATTATKVTLGLSHIVAAAVIIPIIANRLPAARQSTSA